MKCLPFAVVALNAFLATAQAGACTLEDVTIVDFNPTIGSFSDGSSRFATIDGTLNSFCSETSNVSLTITAQAKNGGSTGNKQVTVDNVPPGGMAFSASGIPYTDDTTGYEVTVSSVTPSAFNAKGVKSYDSGASAASTVTQPAINSAASQAGNYAGWVASGIPWYYRH